MRYLVEFQIDVRNQAWVAEDMDEGAWSAAICTAQAIIVSVENVTREMSQEERGG